MLALRRALEQPRSQHCYLRQQPRRAPPSAALPPRGPGRRGCSDPGRGGSTESEERAQGARAGGKCDPRRGGRSARCSGAPGATDSPDPEGERRRSARTWGWGAEPRPPSSLPGKAGEV